jgi:predicted sulfurtransferase
MIAIAVSSVQMYCTGGIRCDVYIALLRQKGFKNLYTRHGGICCDMFSSCSPHMHNHKCSVIV